jgi:ABC-type multidrug transport system ATPase subunit
MITVQHLTYEYPNTKALDDVSFTVQEGTITAKEIPGRTLSAPECGKKMTLIVSSHILAELDQYAKDLLIVKNGQVVNHTEGNRSPPIRIKLNRLNVFN